MYRFMQLSLAQFKGELFIQSYYGIRCSPFTMSRPRPSCSYKQVMKENGFFKCSYVKVSYNLLRYRPNFIPDLRLQRLIQVDSNNNNKCWNCNYVLESVKLYCDSCNSLQPVNKKDDFFNIMGMKRSYSLNQSELKQKFYNLQTLLHPDKFSSKPKKEQEYSEEFSSTVNKAYSTLLDPLERGLYLLSLNNVSIEEGKMDLDKMFLLEIMERNEEIENESDPQKLNKFYKVNREQLDLLIGKVAQAFDNNDIELAKKLLTEMKYYNTIEKKIKEIKQKLHIPD